MPKKYNFERKKKLADKISKIKDKDDLVQIFEIIYEDNQSVTENNNNLFLYFHKLQDTTYEDIEKYLKRLNKKKQYFTDSLTSEENLTDTQEYKPYSQDEFPSQKGISPKLKYSNKEKNLIKRRRYIKNIDEDNEHDNNIVYKQFNISDSESSAKN